MRYLVSFVLIALIVTACTNPGSGGDGDRNGGDGEVPAGARGQIERIEASSDCEELQVIFDASAGAHDRFSDEEPPNLEMMQVHTAIMGAADDRMLAVGCY